MTVVTGMPDHPHAGDDLAQHGYDVNAGGPVALKTVLQVHVAL